MLKQLTTKNFRKLVDNSFTFSPGLCVVRGANEAGKTTMLEAIAYGAFGVKACRDPLAELVTWGQPEKALVVEQVWVLGGIEYHLKRSKAGAEINYTVLGGNLQEQAQRVVGQAEVTAFMERQLGCSADIAGKLMIASQTSIRGALEEGPTKTAELIEELADFAVIDRVIDLVQTHLTTGPDSLAEDRVKRAEDALAAARAVAVVDPAPAQACLQALQGRLARAVADLDQRRPAHDAAARAVQEAREAVVRRQGLQGQLDRAATQAKAREHDLRNAQQAALAGPAPAALEAARRRVTEAEQAEKTLSIFQQFSALGYPAAYWEGSEEAFQEEMSTVTSERAARRAEIASIDARVKELRASLHSAGDKCKTCGQKLPNAAAIAAHNASVTTAIEAQARLRINAAEALEEANVLGDGLLEVERLAKPILAFYARHSDKVQADSGYFPPKLVWAGPAVVAQGIDTLSPKEQLTRLETAQRAADQAKARAEMLSKALEEDLHTISRLNAEFDALHVADQLDIRQAKLEEVALEYNTLSADVAELRLDIEKTRGEIATVKAAQEQARRAVEAAEKTLVQAKEELEQLHFNNALLKRVRTARPVIADKLWSMVLTAVSTYFSAMRGTKSVVSREGKQFKVDGRAGALSGSTLDILGLAIRVSLTRMFLPNATFLILDEPAAAMDEQRASAMLGFLVAAGFPQTILVTHEEMSETVAENLIRI